MFLRSFAVDGGFSFGMPPNQDEQGKRECLIYHSTNTNQKNVDKDAFIQMFCDFFNI